MDLCAGLRARPYTVLKSLRALQGAGLVDAGRLRLTLPGLAIASALASPAAVAENAPPSSAAAPALQLPGLARCAA